MAEQGSRACGECRRPGSSPAGQQYHRCREVRVIVTKSGVCGLGDGRILPSTGDLAL